MSDVTSGTGTKAKAVAIDHAVQSIYANGFGLGAGNADGFIVLQYFNKQIATISMSMILMKTLANGLSGLVAEWEKTTGIEIPTTHELDAALNSPKKHDPSN